MFVTVFTKASYEDISGDVTRDQQCRESRRLGRLREELGPEVEIYGGTPVSLLLNGLPAEVYDATCRILESGIKTGGKFILHEANNLPPCVPEENPAAMYQACLDKGRYQPFACG